MASKNVDMSPASPAEDPAARTPEDAPRESATSGAGTAARAVSRDVAPQARRPSRAVTLEIRDTCLCMHTQRAARSLARMFDEALRPVGLTHGQFSLLMSLNRPEAPSIKSVAELLGMDRTSLTAKLKPLERRGLIEVRADPEDRRSRRLALTESGGTLLVRAVPIWRRTHRKLDQILPSRAQTELRGRLHRLVTEAHRSGPSVPGKR